MGRLMVKSETAAQHLREVKRKENDVYTFIAFCSFPYSFLLCSALAVACRAMLMTELELPKNCSMKNKCLSPLISLSLAIFSLLFFPPPPSSSNLLLRLTHVFQKHNYTGSCAFTPSNNGAPKTPTSIGLCHAYYTKETGEPSKSNPKKKLRRKRKKEDEEEAISQKRENGSGTHLPPIKLLNSTRVAWKITTP